MLFLLVPTLMFSPLLSTRLSLAAPLICANNLSPNGNFQLESYNPTLRLDSPNCHNSFAATNPYPAKTLILEVQQPIGATNLTTNPVLGLLTRSPDGLNYQILIRTSVPPTAKNKHPISRPNPSSASNAAKKPKAATGFVATATHNYDIPNKLLT